MSERTACPKCGATSGNNWSQCKKSCPIEGSPHYVAPKRWCIQIQERSEYNGQYATDDWRGYRKFSVWPKTFATEREAFLYMQLCFTFVGLRGRKMSASTRLCGTKQRPAPGMHA